MTSDSKHMQDLNVILSVVPQAESDLVFLSTRGPWTRPPSSVSASGPHTALDTNPHSNIHSVISTA